jgi:hypothetical protein
MSDRLKTGALIFGTIIFGVMLILITQFGMNPKRNPPSASGSLANINPPIDCTLTIRNSLVPLMSEPKRLSKKISKIRPGDYTPFKHTIVSFGQQEEGWFQVEVAGQTGWIADDTWAIDHKSSSCP